MAFFRFADKDMPHFYLTKDEIIRAIKIDKKWEEDANESFENFLE